MVWNRSCPAVSLHKHNQTLQSSRHQMDHRTHTGSKFNFGWQYLVTIADQLLSRTNCYQPILPRQLLPSAILFVKRLSNVLVSQYATRQIHRIYSKWKTQCWDNKHKKQTEIWIVIQWKSTKLVKRHSLGCIRILKKEKKEKGAKRHTFLPQWQWNYLGAFTFYIYSKQSLKRSCHCDTYIAVLPVTFRAIFFLLLSSYQNGNTFQTASHHEKNKTMKNNIFPVDQFMNCMLAWIRCSFCVRHIN